jgi:hypothetical protein
MPAWHTIWLTVEGPMNGPSKLSGAQHLYLQTIFDYFNANGTWPTFTYVDRHLYQTADLDAEEIAKSLANSAFSGFYTSYTTPDQPTSLPIPALAYCEGAHNALEVLVQVIQLCVSKERKGDLTLSSAELHALSGASDFDLQKILALLQANPELTNGCNYSAPANWSVGIPRRIRKYRNVKSVEQLLDAYPEEKSLAPVVIQQPLIGLIGAQAAESLAPPPEIQDSLARFQQDYTEAGKVAFIMMRFDETPAHQRITEEIKKALSSAGIVGVRADDREYHPDLWPNVLTYLHGCDFGIAVFERIEREDFNPNVALEVGYMLALGKDVCFLKDQTLTVLPADLIGKLYKPFNVQRIPQSISPKLRKWLIDKGYTQHAI